MHVSVWGWDCGWMGVCAYVCVHVGGWVYVCMCMCVCVSVCIHVPSPLCLNLFEIHFFIPLTYSALHY